MQAKSLDTPLTGEDNALICQHKAYYRAWWQTCVETLPPIRVKAAVESSDSPTTPEDQD